MKIHFFTVVLNGQPYIEYHKRLMEHLPMHWHWHVIEGMVQDAGLPSRYHSGGRSVDGTSEYLDMIEEGDPERITIYRKPLGKLWESACEMLNAPLGRIDEACLLWQIDPVDLWTIEQIEQVCRLFESQPSKSAAYFWCWFFIGENKVISTRYGFSADPQKQWLRVWRYLPGDHWIGDESPRLQRRGCFGSWLDVAMLDPLPHEATESVGAVFVRRAYVLREQVLLEQAYGASANLVDAWERLQQSKGPVALSDYFEWGAASVWVDDAEALSLHQLAGHRFGENVAPDARPSSKPVVVVDCEFFQYSEFSGITRYWRSILKEWVVSGFADHVICLVRGEHFPNVEGVHYFPIRRYSNKMPATESLYLQAICDLLGADVFVSSYFSSPIETPTVFAGHDMIPERMGFDLAKSFWQQKAHSIQNAKAHVMVSENSAKDLEALYPCVPRVSTVVAHNGVSDDFQPASEEAVTAFREQYGLLKPYVLYVGERMSVGGYKNAVLLFRAMRQLRESMDVELLCVGGARKFEKELRMHSKGMSIQHLFLDDEALQWAYTGAHALVFPSKYEGFGLPLLEAMSCGCPVVTCDNSSLREVAGNAAVYVDADDPKALCEALLYLSDPTVRADFIAQGFERKSSFQWHKTATLMAQVLQDVADTSMGVPVSPKLRESRQREADVEEALGRCALGMKKWGQLVQIERSWKYVLYRCLNK